MGESSSPLRLPELVNEPFSVVQLPNSLPNSMAFVGKLKRVKGKTSEVLKLGIPDIFIDFSSLKSKGKDFRVRRAPSTCQVH